MASITKVTDIPTNVLKPGSRCKRFTNGVLTSDTTFEAGVNYGTTSFPLRSFSSLVYESGPKHRTMLYEGKNIKIPIFKTCDHLQIHESYTPGPPRDYYLARPFGSNPTYYVDTGTLDGYPTASHQSGWRDNPDYACNTLGLVPSHSTVIDAYKAEAASAAKALFLDDQALLGFRTGFNIINFILELRDVKRLPDLITKWSKSDRDISDKFLGLNFGLIPFASDIKSIANNLVNLGPAIDRWNKDAKAGRILNMHRSLPLPISLKGHPNRIVPDQAPSDGVHLFEFVNRNVAHSFGTQYGNYITSRSYGSYDAHLAISGKVHMYFRPKVLPDSLIDDLKREIWGINKPLTAAWNALPYSFVLDWFANIGELIEDFEKKAPLLDIEIVDAGYSVRYNGVFKSRLSQTLDPLPNYDCGSGETLVSRFYRNKLTPGQLVTAGHKYSSLQFQQSSFQQNLLGSALLHQRLR